MKVKPCILIMEDDEAILEMVSTALDYAGFNVAQATNGKVGLSLVENLHPALIYLDMHMPVMDGWDFLSLYYAQPGPYVPTGCFQATPGFSSTEWASFKIACLRASGGKRQLFARQSVHVCTFPKCAHGLVLPVNGAATHQP